LGWLRRRAQIPAGLGTRVPAAPPRAGDRRQDADRDGLGRHVRPGRRRLRALLGRRALAGAALREDALRQRPPRTYLFTRVAGDRRSALQARRLRDARLGSARDARPGGRLLFGARRGLGGRGGPLLRVVARRAARGGGRRGGSVVR